MSRLVVVSGAPGVGKTTIARELARRLGAVHLRVDSIEAAVLNAGGGPIHAQGYAAAYAVAGDNLALGLDVVADCVNPLELTRRAWADVAESVNAELISIEVTCSDEAEHRRRVADRHLDEDTHDGRWRPPTWEEVQAAVADHEPWTSPRVVLDTAGLDPVAAADLAMSILDPTPEDAGDLSGVTDGPDAQGSAPATAADLATTLSLWCSPQPPEFWRAVFERGFEWTAPHEFWVVYRAWGAEGMLAHETDRVLDVVAGIPSSVAWLDATLALACTPEERLFCMQEAYFGMFLATVADPQSVQATKEYLLAQDMGDPVLQAAYLRHLTMRDVVDLVSSDVTDADIASYLAAFPDRDGVLYVEDSLLSDVEWAALEYGVEQAFRSVVDEALESEDPRIVTVSMGLAGPERDPVIRRIRMQSAG